MLRANVGLSRKVSRDYQSTGYTVNFVTIIALYSVATVLYWHWFRAVDRRRLAARAATG